MKKIFFYLCLIVLGACSKGEVFDISTTEIIVVDENNKLMEGVELKIYASQQEFILDRNALTNKEWRTNSEGSAFVSDLSKSVPRYWISAEAGDKNNWDEPKILDMTVFPTRIVIIIKPSVANELAGRFEKRWKQLHQTINGQRFEECDKKNEYVFRRDFSMDIYSSAACATGSLIRNDTWQLGTSANQLALGTPTRPTQQKNVTILELSPSKFMYYYTIKSPTGVGVTVVEELEAINP